MYRYDHIYICIHYIYVYTLHIYIYITYIYIHYVHVYIYTIYTIYNLYAYIIIIYIYLYPYGMPTFNLTSAHFLEKTPDPRANLTSANHMAQSGRPESPQPLDDESCFGFATYTGWWFGTWILWLSIYWECHHPNCYSLIFFRGVG